MKRYIVALFVFVMISSANAFAQQDGKNQAVFGEPKPLLTIIKALAGKQPVHNDAGISDAVMWEGELDYSDRRAAIDMVLKNTPFEARDQADGIHVIRKGVGTGALRDELEELERTPASTSLPRSGLGSKLAATIMVQRAEAARHVPSHYPQPTRSTYRYGGGLGSGNTVRYGYHPYWMEAERRYVYRGITGSLRPRGDTKGVDIFADGCFIGDARYLDGRHDDRGVMWTGRPIRIVAVKRKTGMAIDKLGVFPPIAQSQVVGTVAIQFGINDGDFTTDKAWIFTPAKKAELEAQCQPDGSR